MSYDMIVYDICWGVMFNSLLLALVASVISFDRGWKPLTNYLASSSGWKPVTNYLASSSGGKKMKTNLGASCFWSLDLLAPPFLEKSWKKMFCDVCGLLCLCSGQDSDKASGSFCLVSCCLVHVWQVFFLPRFWLVSDSCCLMSFCKVLHRFSLVSEVSEWSFDWIWSSHWHDSAVFASSQWILWFCAAFWYQWLDLNCFTLWHFAMDSDEVSEVSHPGGLGEVS